jgi:shikimate kinase
VNFILFGFKKSGKTHFGRLLAQELSREFVDTDNLIEKMFVNEYCESLCARNISLKIGEDGFRILEKRVIHSLKNENAIIAVGGGAVLDSENRNKLSSLGQLFYLKIDKETLKHRLLNAELPSFLDPKNLEISFEKMYAERKMIYEKIPAITIKTVGKNERDILEEIKSHIYE